MSENSSNCNGEPIDCRGLSLLYQVVVNKSHFVLARGLIVRQGMGIHKVAEMRCLPRF